MELKRFSLEDLIQKCSDLFYSYMLHSKSCYIDNRYIKCQPDETPLTIHNNKLQRLKQKQVELLDEQQVALSYSKRMKDIRLYHRTIEHLARTIIIGKKVLVDIPLNKKINSYYDDFILEVVYEYKTSFEDFSEKYLLSSPANLEELFKSSINVTNMSLLHVNGFSLSFLIELIGKGDLRACSLCLCPKFAGFDKLTLSDIMNINNNDVRQILQSKIDLDKEDLEEVANVFIRGSNYMIFRKKLRLNYKVENSYTYYIRYVCPSTQRVYYNELNLQYLALSDYFDKNTYESYAKAWWNIVHVGAKCEGTTIVSC